MKLTPRQLIVLLTIYGSSFQQYTDHEPLELQQLIETNLVYKSQNQFRLTQLGKEIIEHILEKDYQN